jgi:hypothetical protein
MDWPKTNKVIRTAQEVDGDKKKIENGNYWAFVGSNQAYKVPIICHIIHLINNGTI